MLTLTTKAMRASSNLVQLIDFPITVLILKLPMKKLLSKRPQTVPIFIKRNAFDCSRNTCIKQATCLVHVRIVFSSLSHPLKKIEMTRAMICRSAHSLLARARGADQKYVERDDVRPCPACAGEILKRINRRAIWICV